MEEAGAKMLISCLGLTSLVDYLLLETSLLRSISQTSCKIWEDRLFSGDPQNKMFHN